MDNQIISGGRSNDAPPPGWYPNPANELQWWDGTSWGPVAPIQKANPLSVGWNRNEDGEEQWWDGNEWWDRTEAFDLLILHSHQTASVPGWFESTTGDTQWWDGRRWLSNDEVTAILLGSTLHGLTAATAEPIYQDAYPAPTKKKGLGCLGWFGVIAVIAIVLFGAAGVVSQLPNEESSGYSRSSVPVTEEPVSPIESRDVQMEEQGFKTFQSGEVWLKSAETGSFTCDSGTKCLWYTLVSFSGCPAGYYVKADIINTDGLGIDWTNTITASVAPNDGVAFQMSTMVSGAEKFLVTEVNCMG